MEISTDKISKLMSKVYDTSYFGSPDQCDAYIKELLEEFESKENQEFRIYTVEELRAMPEGTIFEHSKRGRFWITVKSNKLKCATFQQGGTINLIQNGNPWDQPIKMIYSEKG